MLLDLLRDPLFRSVLMTLCLLPCAIQDYRTRRVSNWLTLPLFLIAWPVAILTDHFPLTFAVFVGVYIASKLEPQFGAADGKLMVGLAAFVPSTLAIGVMAESLIFVLFRLKGQKQVAIPGAPWLFLACALNTAVRVILTAW